MHCFVIRSYPLYEVRAWLRGLTTQVFTLISMPWLGNTDLYEADTVAVHYVFKWNKISVWRKEAIYSDNVHNQHRPSYWNPTNTSICRYRLDTLYRWHYHFSYRACTAYTPASYLHEAALPSYLSQPVFWLYDCDLQQNMSEVHSVQHNHKTKLRLDATRYSIMSYAWVFLGVSCPQSSATSPEPSPTGFFMKSFALRMWWMVLEACSLVSS